jgi:hypothetical protein
MGSAERKARKAALQAVRARLHAEAQAEKARLQAEAQEKARLELIEKHKSVQYNFEPVVKKEEKKVSSKPTSPNVSQLHPASADTANNLGQLAPLTEEHLKQVAGQCNFVFGSNKSKPEFAYTSPSSDQSSSPMSLASSSPQIIPMDKQGQTREVMSAVWTFVAGENESKCRSLQSSNSASLKSATSPDSVKNDTKAALNPVETARSTDTLTDPAGNREVEEEIRVKTDGADKADAPTEVDNEGTVSATDVAPVLDNANVTSDHNDEPVSIIETRKEDTAPATDATTGAEPSENTNVKLTEQETCTYVPAEQTDAAKDVSPPEDTVQQDSVDVTVEDVGTAAATTIENTPDTHNENVSGLANVDTCDATAAIGYSNAIEDVPECDIQHDVTRDQLTTASIDVANEASAAQISTNGIDEIAGSLDTPVQDVAAVTDVEIANTANDDARPIDNVNEPSVQKEDTEMDAADVTHPEPAVCDADSIYGGNEVRENVMEITEDRAQVSEITARDETGVAHSSSETVSEANHQEEVDSIYGDSNIIDVQDHTGKSATELNDVHTVENAITSNICHVDDCGPGSITRPRSPVTQEAIAGADGPSTITSPKLSGGVLSWARILDYETADDAETNEILLPDYANAQVSPSTRIRGGLPNAQVGGRAGGSDSGMAAITTLATDASHTQLVDGIRKQTRKASSTSSGPGNSSTSKGSSASSTDPITDASRSLIGAFSLMDFLEALEKVGGDAAVWSRGEVASAFWDLSNEELADLDKPTMEKPEYLDEVLQSKTALRKIRLNTIKLGQFLGMIDFDIQGAASDAAICQAWLSASEQDMKFRERFVHRVASLSS